MNPRSLLITLSILLLPFLSMVSAAVPGNWAAGVYEPGALVIHEGITYIATQTVSANEGNPATATAYWSSLEDIASGLGGAPSGQPTGTPGTSPPADKPPETNATSSNIDSSARLVNISTRGYVGSGANQQLVGGFVLKGTPGGTKTILVKGVAQYMVGADGLTSSDLLDNPKLQLQDAFGKVVAINDDWKTQQDLSSVASDQQSTFAVSYDSSGLQGADYAAYRNELNAHDNAAAMLITVPLLTSEQAASLFGNAAYAGYNLFTAVVSSSSGSAGVAQVAIEDLDRSGDYNSTAKLVNISTRGYVGSGANQQLVGGFVLLGQAGKAKTLLAKGSAEYMLGADGLTTADLLADPQLKLQDIVGKAVARNDNWGTAGSLTSEEQADPSTLSTSYDVSGLPGSSYDLYRNELDNHNSAAAMLINLPIMTSDQASSLAGNSAYAGYALYTAIVSGSGSASGVAQITIEDLDRN